MDQDTSKALIIAAVFTALFAFFATPGGGDYAFHFDKAATGCDNLGSNCDSYTPGFHALAWVFSFHEDAFFYFVIFLLAFVTPMLLHWITKNWVVVWLYFATTSYFWFMVDGIFPQALAGVALLLILGLKDWRIQSVVVLLSILVHSQAFFLSLLAFFAVHAYHAFKKDGVNIGGAKLFPACSGLFGKNRPEILGEQVARHTSGGYKFTYADALIVFTKIFPLPFFYWSVKHLWTERKRLDFILVAFAALVMGFFVSPRVFYVIPLALLPGLAWFYQKLSKEQKWKKHAFILLTIVSFAFQLYSWANFREVCGTT